MTDLTELMDALRAQGCSVSKTVEGKPRYWITLPSEWTYLLTTHEMLALHTKGKLTPAGIHRYDKLRRRVARKPQVKKSAEPLNT